MPQWKTDETIANIKLLLNTRGTGTLLFISIFLSISFGALVLTFSLIEATLEKKCRKVEAKHKVL
jgi:hypothetical protein